MQYKRVYDAYLKRVEVLKDVLELLPPEDFYILPFNTMLSMAGAKIKLKSQKKTYELNCMCCRALEHLATAIPFEVHVPKLSDYAKHNLKSDDVYMLGTDGDWHLLFPFEYEILFEN